MPVTGWRVMMVPCSEIGMLCEIVMSIVYRMWKNVRFGAEAAVSVVVGRRRYIIATTM